MTRMLVVSVASFALALGAVAGLGAYTATHPSAAEPVWLAVSQRIDPTRAGGRGRPDAHQPRPAGRPS